MDSSEMSKECWAPQIPSGFDRPLDSSFFQVYRDGIDSKFKNITEMLKKEENPLGKNAINVIILCGEHSSENLWTTDSSPKLADELLKAVLSREKVDSIETLLVQNNQKIFKSLLEALRPFVLKNTWKMSPASVFCYAWILKKVKSPNLGEHLNKVLPTALIISDDFEPQNRAIGLHCLHHIILNVAKHELTMYDCHLVIIEALKRCLYDTSPETVEPLLATFADLLLKLKPQIPFAQLKRDEFDEIYDIILNNMYLTTVNNKMRILYLKCLPSLIAAKGLSIIRQCDLIYKIIDEHTFDQSYCPLALKTLEKTVQTAYPRENFIFDSTILIILKIVYNHSRNEPRMTQEIEKNVVDILKLLNVLYPERIKRLLHEMSDNQGIVSVYNFLSCNV